MTPTKKTEPEVEITPEMEAMLSEAAARAKAGEGGVVERRPRRTPSQPKVNLYPADGTRIDPLDSAIADLFSALKLSQEDISQIDLGSRGTVRIFGVDRSLRTIKASPWKRREQ